ncbi:MAG: hypothetical protein COZ07_00825 [Candidatus Infernicultor aquiphilus]|uniref:Uncharacterized protein n=1 Tax=Candidatus Infernicultor aquiphilus TaxID=1805029 RepID=A0A1J5GQR4_9BACT|nr:MAG: hypothetical protein AUK42_03805 [Candidatus Atribacteria bacterium CG2_30_33_13]PIW12366.1 MAG: hypothetical protein COW35_01835 [Candidatus Atribacteria bacterium CG17_big_fil_post_rev_8_21_14_2_50_34_11]PIX35303.1 MAG: hypothetical protein COZ58_00510 [Candidatus Atribacteria bacterium CG_4_8_14_3_um_filter_34_18]PIY33823.1 MAG: hypothetical protein COZ07_00825 [Candidatus Atribacteria bacterium CG_4_10_14_3_um_filter_34_13]PJB57125.1 MAG: hypothetical protein CO097_03270 [Candidatus
MFLNIYEYFKKKKAKLAEKERSQKTEYRSQNTELISFLFYLLNSGFYIIICRGRPCVCPE